MKKKYMQPLIEVIELKMGIQVLVGSPETIPVVQNPEDLINNPEDIH